MKDLMEMLGRLEKLLVLSAKEALNVKEAALFIGVTENRIRVLVWRKEIPYYKRGRSLFFKKSELEEWMLRDRVLSNEEIEMEANSYCLSK